MLFVPLAAEENLDAATARLWETFRLEQYLAWLLFVRRYSYQLVRCTCWQIRRCDIEQPDMDDQIRIWLRIPHAATQSRSPSVETPSFKSAYVLVEENSDGWIGSPTTPEDQIILRLHVQSSATPVYTCRLLAQVVRYSRPSKR